MASQMECFNDFCLSCDRQIAENGVYCSQSCRLADLERAGTTAQAPSQLSSSASSSSSSNSGFYLAPAINFSAYKAASTTSQAVPSSPYHYYPTANGSYFAPPTATRQSPQRSLTPSSSRSSLASSSSSSRTQSGISQQAATQLSSYVRSFDQTRDVKRRYTQY
ncbi:hypothetical protein COCC4DRAFT_27036 [Bipolaris maydis ATCC 48331]|uniref:Life-span regulatory factor domain-containing protein n=5 Tax=Bipolaris TaxID=33194 RepID=M2V9Q6_COCH5|nr:uncharacterized protein COCMIDRAFT_101911 [Bipolaris oryzae ATCC 44560]XP_007702020.1 uncharacterized protein COCSADRAFT_162283 [Bipolaris sorokiniana ND90Pr]XP_014074961.1 uncharacterized protein COCC4DRAFT_27036 [Bipolaris maydis ATCC 48331]EMD96423.1 hypothetical protein COCHEDRAFT_1150137 [Bipolaris maydis C5]KAF5847235.1 hypothetical protein GGP41_003533 [Bipolaris sorokiniana]KAH7548988.1 hypothetical protein BM1_10761 [Bipolaris maydis]EMD62721.1 hypothetical protein COCSADRAFT_1622